jgi:hypothetical protein
MQKIAISVLLTFSGAVPASVPFSPWKPAELKAADRGKIEQVACVGPYHVAAKKIEGLRSIYEERAHRLQAYVECEPHVSQPGYDTFYVRHCEKRFFGWRCAIPSMRLVSTFLGRGPFEMGVQEVTVDTAVAGLRCLEYGLQRHDILDMRSGGEPNWILPDNGPSADQTAIFISMNDEQHCLIMRVAVACGPDVDNPIELVSEGCVEE